MIGPRWRKAAALATVLCVAACGPTARDRAIAIAADKSSLVNPVLFNVYEGTIGNQANTWIITFRGNHQSCDGPGVPGSPESMPCAMTFGEAIVRVDATTGAVLGTSFSSILP